MRESRADDSAGALLKAVEDVARTVEKIEALRIADAAEETRDGNSSQALFLAIRSIGTEIELVDGVTWGGQQPWEALAERGDAGAG